MKHLLKSLFEEQPEERFFSLKLTKLVLWSFGFLFVITFAISLSEAVTLEFKPTSEGVNYLVFELFKAPVAVTGFALPLLGLIGLNHRSEQTKKQISATGDQNRFANYFKHLEEFKKHVEGLDLDARKHIDRTKIRLAHDTLFSRAYEFGDYKIHSEVLEIVYDYLTTASAYIKGIKTEKDLIKLPEEFSYFSGVQSMFGMKDVIENDVANILPLDDEHSIEENNEFILELLEFIDILRSIVAFSNNANWDGRLVVIANSIRIKLAAIERDSQLSIEAERKEFEDGLKDKLAKEEYGF